MRTNQISKETVPTPDAGRGSGTETTIRYECPCGQGQVVEFHDRTPGVTEHWAKLYCDRCEQDWEIDKSIMAVSRWELVRKSD